MNTVMLCGRLISDPEVRYSQGANGQMAIARLTLAVDRKYKREGQPTADFIPCLAFGKNGEFAEKYLKKGTKVIVTGSWQTGNYTNKDGVKVYTNDCLVDGFEFCESKSASNQGATPAEKPRDTDFMDIPLDSLDEELPFN